MRTKYASLVLGTLFLLGAGCSTAPQTTAPAPTPAPMPVPTTTAPTREVEIGLGSDGRLDITTEPFKVRLDSGNFYFKPDTITAAPGQPIEITVDKNAGFHTFVIDGISLKEIVKQDGVISFIAPTQPGSYEFYCDVGSHKAMGMKGALVVK